MATIEKKLTNHPYAQCKVMINVNNIILISYKTRIISVRRYNNSYIIRCYGLYSATTRRHISWFLREYFNNVSYSDIKKIANTNDFIHIDKNNNISVIKGGF